jgi:cell shape-determining protein MreC
MEALMQPFPVVNKSQLEDLYKINHELRTKLNDLERMLEELQNTIRANTKADNDTTESN